MKAYKVELLVIDFDEIGEDGIVDSISCVNYPNDCISPKVMRLEGRNIGDWDDDHPLNSHSTSDDYYNELFAKGE